LESVFIVVVLGLIPAAIARHKGRNFFLWWLYGSVLLIVAIPHAVFFLRKTEPSPFGGPQTQRAAPKASTQRTKTNEQAPRPEQAPAATTKVFISHSSKDQKAAETICSALENRGIQCWFSARDVDPGENFQQSIHRAIRSAKLMVLVFSRNANTSPEINKEIALAGQYQLVVIPVRTEDVVPNDALAYELATRQWIDLFNDWERSVERLVSRIAAIAPSASA
jgi:hypothetical protein